MLNITVSQNDNTNLSFSAFEQYQLPAPPSGADAEINDDLILKFEDEEDAIVYAAQLQNLANELNDKDTPQYVAISNIIMAIHNDEFVQSYTR
jgi:hypothetical protein